MEFLLAELFTECGVSELFVSADSTSVGELVAVAKSLNALVKVCGPLPVPFVDVRWTIGVLPPATPQRKRKWMRRKPSSPDDHDYRFNRDQQADNGAAFRRVPFARVGLSPRGEKHPETPRNVSDAGGGS